MLEPIGKVPLAKIMPLSDRFSANFKGIPLVKKLNPPTLLADLFEGLTPLVVHQALVAWDVQKGELVNVEVGLMREPTDMLNGVLASLNLPAALEESEGESLPQSLKDKARDVRLELCSALWHWKPVPLSC